MKNSNSKNVFPTADVYGYIVLDPEFNLVFSNKKASALIDDVFFDNLKKKVEGTSGDRAFMMNLPQGVFFCKYERTQESQSVMFCRKDELEKTHIPAERLEALENEFQIILDHIDDSIFVMNNEGTVIRANASAKQQFHMKKLIGANAYDYMKNGYVSESVAAIIIDKQIKEKLNLITKYPGLPDMLCTGIPYYENGKLKFVVTCEREMDNLETLKQDLMKALSYEELYKDDYRKYMVGEGGNNAIISSSERMQNLMNTVRKAAGVDSTVLLTGESGVGKEVFAEYLYSHSKRNGKPFVKVNCGAIPESLWEAELFGYAPASFTGASKAGKPGYFELANGGTLLLDEISEMPLHLQVKLLRVLQEKEIIRVGGIKPVPINVQIIATTNRNLPDEIKKGTFREDLFYRLNVLSIEIPALRERKGDIKYLALFFIEQCNEKYDMNKEISSSAIKLLENYRWPGNVRELKNLIERLVVMNSTEKIGYYDVFQHISNDENEIVYEKNNGDSKNGSNKSIYDNSINNDNRPYEETVEDATTIGDLKKQLLIKLMKQYNGNTQSVALAMGVTRSTVNRMLKKYELR